MVTVKPSAFRWDGESFRPLRQTTADLDLSIGSVYWLVEHHDRSEISHRHQFAWLREAWLNLPEELADRFPSPEHLRKAALIESGFYDEEIIDCGTKETALRVAAYIRRDDFVHVVTRGPLVVVRTAKSQSLRAMGAADFQASKQALLETVAAMIGVSVERLERIDG